MKRTAVVIGIVITAMVLSLDGYVLLKTFVLPTAISSVEQETSTQEASNTEAVVTDTSYQDDNIHITLTTIREYDTDIYIADILLTKSEYLKTAMAQGMFGTNITQKTSELAQQQHAIFAINGDYYGANSSGYVIKNGTIYRESVRSDSEYEDLVIYSDGSFELINEEDVSAQELLSNGVVQLFAFGPALIQNQEICVTQQSEVKKSMNANPRTVIGIIDELHYIVMVSDGRTSQSEGLSLYEAAEIMQEYGCTLAYNLDGGGSSTMYFNGSVINQPTTNGNRISERAVSDIVYIGY